MVVKPFLDYAQQMQILTGFSMRQSPPSKEAEAQKYAAGVRARKPEMQVKRLTEVKP